MLIPFRLKGDSTAVLHVGVVMTKMRAGSRKGMIVTTIALDRALHRRLALASVEKHAAIAELLRQAAREWLDRTNRKGEAEDRP